jgi:hypothetical protein
MIDGSGTYFPSDYERMMANAQKANFNQLMEFAALNNRRTIALARVAARAAHGGTPLEVAERLFNTKEGMVYRHGASMMNNLLGNGSHVDLMAGQLNIAQFGGLGVQSFGRSSESLYGSGMVANVIAEKMFREMDKRLINPNGTDNLAATQGLDISTVGKLQQELASTGRYANTKMAEIKETTLLQRTNQIIKDLESDGNTAGVKRVRDAAITAGGDEVKLKELLTALSKDETVSGDVKGMLDTALKTKSSVILNEQGMNKIAEDTEKNAKLLVKLQNIFGDVDSVLQNIKGISGADMRVEGALDRVSADIDRFNRNARAAGFGDDLGGFAARNQQTFAALSQVYGSASAASAVSSDVTAQIIYQQRLNKASGGTQSDSEVAQTVINDIAGASTEQNLVEQRRLAYEASLKGPEARAAAVKLADDMSRELDPVQQQRLLSEFKSKFNISDTTNLSDIDITKALGEDVTGVGTATLRNQTEYAADTVFRSWESHTMRREGIDSSTKDEYLKLAKVLGSQDMAKLFGEDPELRNEILKDKDKMQALADAGVDTSKIQEFVATNKDSLGALTKVIMDDSTGNAYGGTYAQKQRDIETSKAAIKEAEYGSGRSDMTQHKSLLQLGTNMLLNNKKAATEKDVMEYKLLSEIEDPLFTVNKKTGSVEMSDSQREELIAKYGGENPQILKDILSKPGNFAEFQDYMRTQGGSVGVKGDKGTIVSAEEMRKGLDFLNQESKKSVIKNMGIKESDLKDGELTMEGARRILEDDYDLDDYDDVEDEAIDTAENIVTGSGYSGEDGAERRKKDAYKFKIALDKSGYDPAAVYKELGKNILEDDEYEEIRKTLGINNLSEDTREELAETTDLNALASYTLNKTADPSYQGTEEEKRAVAGLRAAASSEGGSNSNIGYMRVELMEVIKRSE